MVRCAEETGAGLVGPLTMVGELPGESVHMAGGAAHVENVAGKRHLVEERFYAGVKASEIPGALRRQETELLEFHCLLARTALLRELGPLDEPYLAGDKIDLCLACERGGERLSRTGRVG
jgi:hypothetical protein